MKQTKTIIVDDNRNRDHSITAIDVISTETRGLQTKSYIWLFNDRRLIKVLYLLYYIKVITLSLFKFVSKPL